jgi:hypothetical protein
MPRFLWCEAVGHAVRKHAELKRFYTRKLAQKALGKAKVAAARKPGIRVWIMLRDEVDHYEFCRRGRMITSSASIRRNSRTSCRSASSSSTVIEVCIEANWAT